MSISPQIYFKFATFGKKLLPAGRLEIIFAALKTKTEMTKHYLTKLEETVRLQWDEPALCNYKGEQFTFGELATSIEKFHILFDKAGFGKGSRMAICAKNSARWAVSYLAICTHGAVVVPILADFTPESVNHLVHHSESSVLFTDPDIWEKLSIAEMPLVSCVVSVKDFSLLYCADPAIDEAYTSLEESFRKKFPMGFGRENISYPTDNAGDLAVINYTSGTTSAPKGVMLRHGSFTATVEFAQNNVIPRRTDNMVSMLPLAHMYGLAFEFLYPMISGVTVYFLGKTPSPSTLLKAMQEVKPYMVITVPLVMEKVYKSSLKPALSKVKGLLWIPGIGHAIYRKAGKKLQEAFGGKVRVFIMGGAGLNPEVERCFRRIGLPYMVGYGMTEACPLLAWETPSKFVFGSCGKPVTCAEVRIDSEDPQHIAGEIQAKGENICIGYYKNPEAEANAFTDDGFLRTGDLGIMDKDGNIFIKGRSKSMILSASGQNIYPEELEAVINSQPYVAESVVVDRSGKIVALVYLDADAIKRDKLDNEAMSDIPETARIATNRQLPAYSQITKVEVMPVPFEKTPKMSIKRFLYK